MNSHPLCFHLGAARSFSNFKMHLYPCYWQTLLVLRSHAAGATQRLGADKNFLCQLFSFKLILLGRIKWKQALLRSNLPGIYPVADEVIR